MIKLSIIVPVYNGEKYLERCIASLEKNNKTEEYEIIIIDDGSSDKTLEIIKKLEKKFKNVHYKSIKKNKGVSNARNQGIKFSSAEYICFCDSDDQYDENTIDRIIKKIEENSRDLYVFDRVDIQDNKQIAYYKCDVSNLSLNEYLYKSFPSSKVTWSVVNKVYKKDIIISNNIFFNVNIKMCEDMLFNLEYNNYITNLDYVNDAKYLRFCNTGSAVYHPNPNFFEENIRVLDYIDFKTKEDAKNQIFLSISYVSIYRLLDNIDCNNFSEFRQKIKKINDLLKQKNIFFDKKAGISNKILFWGMKKNLYLLIYLVLNRLRSLKKRMLWEQIIQLKILYLL